MKTSVAPVGRERILSLDVLRGITIAFMILVNNQIDGVGYWPLKHASWNGCTPTDLVFPTFLFLMGISLVLSTESRLAHGASTASLLSHGLRRFAILFVLGLVVNGYPHFHPGTLRIYGVLQRIALCYLISLLLYLADRRTATLGMVLAFLLVGYWILLRWVPVPGYGVPGHGMPFLDREANLVAYVDRHLFPGRLYEITRDPEGLLSTLPAVGTTLIGVLTGIFLCTGRSFRQKSATLATAGLIGLLAGGVWNYWFPMNKKLWTSSYVLFAGGCALVALAVCIYLVDIQKIERGIRASLVFGRNAIAAYVFAELLQSTLANVKLANHLSLQRNLYLKVLEGVSSPPLASLLYSLAFVFLCGIAMNLLYRRRLFVKI